MPPSISAAEMEELRSHDSNPFDLSSLTPAPALPLPDEAFVACWEGWVEEAGQRGAAAVLGEHLPQLAFPIAEGMSSSEAYRAATLRGVPPAAIPEASGLPLERPGALELDLHPSPAGRVPVVVIRHRADFVTLVQALAKRNEPLAVPASQGAVMIAGYNNWSRVHELRRRWEDLAAEERQTATWGEEFGRIREHKELYQDRFILLSDGPYSAVPAADLDLTEDEWRHLSLAIRRDHECTHYFTRRLFGSMRNHLHDELIADYAGLVAATGRFRADWFLRFLGLDHEPPRPAGRVHIYRGAPPLSEGAFRVWQAWARAAARHVEEFDAGLPAAGRSLEDRALALVALASLSLGELASEGADRRLGEIFTRLRAERRAAAEPPGEGDAR